MTAIHFQICTRSTALHPKSSSHWTLQSICKGWWIHPTIQMPLCWRWVEIKTQKASTSKSQLGLHKKASQGLHHKACQGLQQQKPKASIKRSQERLPHKLAAMMYTSLLPAFLFAKHVQSCIFSNGPGFGLPSTRSNKELGPGMFLFSAAERIFSSPSK